MDIKRGRYRKSVFIVTYFIGNPEVKYLLLKRKLHWTGWEFPKGGRNFLEMKRTSARREVKEETGQKPENIKKYPVSGKFKYQKQYSDRKGYIGQTYSLFSAELKDKKIKIDKKEHSGYKWVDFSTALKMLKWKDQKKCLKIANETIKKEVQK